MLKKAEKEKKGNVNKWEWDMELDSRLTGSIFEGKNLFPGLCIECVVSGDSSPLFMELMKHFAIIVSKEVVLSLEFNTSESRRSFSFCFWEGKNFLMVAFTHCDRDDLVVKSKKLLLDQILNAGSMGPTITSCRGADVDFIKALNRDPLRKTRVQYPFNLIPIQVEKFKHKPSFSIIGKIDLISMLRTLMVRCSGTPDEPCVQSTRFLKKYRFALFKWNIYIISAIWFSVACVFKAL